MPVPGHQDSGATQAAQAFVEKPQGDSAETASDTTASPGEEDGCKRPSGGNPAVFMILGAISFTFMAGMANALGSRCDWRLVAQSRTILSFLAALTLAKLGGATLVFARPRILWMRSFAGTFSLMTTFYALANLPIADVLTLTNTYPIWIVLIGFLVWGEVVEPSLLLAIFSAVLGVILIQQPHLDGNMLAIASALSAAVFTSVAMIGLNRLGSIDPRAVVTHFSGVAALIMIPVISFGHPVDWSDLRDPITLALLAGVGITGTIGQILLTKAYAIGSAPRIAVIGMSQVAMGLVFDIAFRQQLPPTLSLIGMAFVVCPVLWIISRGKGRPSPSASARSESGAVDSSVSPKPLIDVAGSSHRDQISSASARS
jgi:drug/metabolite transporter (DMT)-like permease